MYRSTNSVTLLLTVGLLVSCSPGPSEDEARSVIATLEDYQRAEQFLPPNANPLVTGRILRQYWQAGDRLVYRKSVAGGSEILITDSLTGRKTTVFDPINLANAIGEITGDTRTAPILICGILRSAKTLMSSVSLTKVMTTDLKQRNFLCKSYRKRPPMSFCLRMKAKRLLSGIITCGSETP